MLLDEKHDFGIENPAKAVNSDAAESSVAESGETLEKLSQKSQKKSKEVSVISTQLTFQENGARRSITGAAEQSGQRRRGTGGHRNATGTSAPNQEGADFKSLLK